MGARTLKHALGIALRHPAPGRFPIGGPPESFRGRNFYIVYALDGERTYYVDVITDSDAMLKFREGDNSPLQEARFDFARLSQMPIRINHYFHELTLTDSSATWFLVRHYCGANYFTLWRRRAVRYFRSKKAVNRDNRIDVLARVAEMSLGKRDFKFDPIGLINDKHGGYYWVEFRNKEEIIAYQKVILDSWLDTGELAKDQHQYLVRPKAFATLANHEIEDRRHVALLKAQRSVVWLTLALVGVGLMQISDVRALICGVAVAAWEAMKSGL